MKANPKKDPDDNLVSLNDYRRRRDFSRTPEPAGAPGAGAGGMFVVQKHAASHLHYDFRLEISGALKSWAVPKGPSLDPGDKRLAVLVEDHPLEYAGFEGIIPEGEYGAGTVMVWDTGSYTPEGDPEAMLRKGALKFTLAGRKLRGRWALVRMKRRSEEEGRENWLLMKEKDDEASGRDILAEEPLSAATGRDMDEIASGAEAEGDPDMAALPAEVEGARPAPMPEFISPQLATLVSAAPVGEDFIHEIKYDGYRLLARVEGGTARVFTRSGNDWTARFPRIAKALGGLKVREAWLDGEAVILKPTGVSDFQALQDALGRGDDSGISFIGFDLMYIDGGDLRALPLARRKELLKGVLAGTDWPLRYSDHVEGGGGEFYAALCEHGAEGVVSKRADSAYFSGRSRSWLKAKCRPAQEFVIGGYREPEGARTGFGSLVVGVWDGWGLRHMGRVGTGFTERTLASIYDRLTALETVESPFYNPPTGYDAKGLHWVRPELVCEAEYAEITSDGLLRQASFKGLREDKPASAVTVESPAPPAPAGESSGDPAPEETRVRLTRPEKLLYAEARISKRDLVDYYRLVAERMLPHLANRPLTLVRCPDGWDVDCFFQKHADGNVPAALKRVPIVEEEGGEPVDYATADTVEGLVSLVQMGVLEIHTWNSRRDALERPDKIVFDMDPDAGLPWERLAEGCLLLRNRLLDVGLESFVKTTGGKGFHVVVPIAPELEWERVADFARKVAYAMARDYPGKFTPKMTKESRRGRIFLDWMRNIRGATAVEVYSTRARAGAPVSAPVSWEEVAAGVRPDAFNTGNMRERIKAADPWGEYFKVGQRINDVA